MEGLGLLIWIMATAAFVYMEVLWFVAPESRGASASDFPLGIYNSLITAALVGSWTNMWMGELYGVTGCLVAALIFFCMMLDEIFSQSV